MGSFSPLGLWDSLCTSDAGISLSGGQMLLLTSVRSPLREPDPRHKHNQNAVFGPETRCTVHAGHDGIHLHALKGIMKLTWCIRWLWILGIGAFATDGFQMTRNEPSFKVYSDMSGGCILSAGVGSPRQLARDNGVFLSSNYPLRTAYVNTGASDPRGVLHSEHKHLRALPAVLPHGALRGFANHLNTDSLRSLHVTQH